MAAVVEDITQSNQGSDSVTHSITVPATIVVGQKWLLIITLDGVPTLTGFPVGWNLVKRFSTTTICVTEFWERTVDGTEEDFDLTSSNAQESVTSIVRMSTAGGIEISTGVSANTANPNPDELTPSFGEAETLWFAFVGYDGNRTVNSYPANYVNNQSTQNSSISGGSCGHALAARTLEAASENPGTFELSSSTVGGAMTIGVQPGEEPPSSGGENRYPLQLM